MSLRIVKSSFGEVELIQIVEFDIGNLVQEIITEAKPEVVNQTPWLTAPYINHDGTLNAIVQFFILKTKSRIIMIDTGIGNGKDRTDVPEWANLNTPLIETLSNISISTLDVTDVIFTHIHMDHVGWNTQFVDGVWEPTFPNAKYHFVKDDYEYWKSKPVAEIRDDHAAFDDSVEPIVKAGLANFVDHKFVLGEGISLFPTPGHTPSHVCILIETGSEKLIIAGDVMHHPCQIAHPEWSTDADFDKAQAALTRNNLLKSIANTETLLLGAHFPIPSFGLITHDENNGYTFIPRLV